MTVHESTVHLFAHDFCVSLRLGAPVYAAIGLSLFRAFFPGFLFAIPIEVDHCAHTHSITEVRVRRRFVERLPEATRPARPAAEE
jgi:hypothetical protein